jgi:hypothetical protein
LLGEFGAFGVGIPQRPMKLRAAATIKFVADRLRDELAAVLLPPVNVSDEIIGQGDSHTINASHFIP